MLVNPDMVGVPRYEVGKTYILFFGRNSRTTGLTTPVGLNQGVFDVHNDGVRNRAGNGHILTAMESSLQQHGYGKLTTRALAKGAPTDRSMEKAMFKALVRDLVNGKIKAPSLKEQRR